MSCLKVKLRGALISEIELNQEKEYVGGRKDGCDIRLQAEKGISREHFKLKYTEGRWQLNAISRFGDVFSLGQKVENADLQHGQTFQIPPYEFIFSEVPDADLPESDRELPALEFGEDERTVIGAAPQVPYVKMVSSQGEVREMLRLEVGEVWVAGRDPSCQIIIPDQRVSRRQFEIYKVNSAYTILDLGSANGTFLNGSPVSSTDPQTLKSGDAINVLDNTMYFEMHDPNFKNKIERIGVPPLQIEEIANEEEVPEIPQEFPEVEEYDVQQQLTTTEGPFTGMPSGASGEEGLDQNQYYNVEPPPQAVPVSGLEKIIQNKPMLIGIVLAILVGAYFLSEMLHTPEVAPVVGLSDEPFSRLTKAQQKDVIEYYTLAEQMHSQQKYDLALEKIKKLKEILPTGYKKSAELELDSVSANETYIQKMKDEEAVNIRAELIAQNKETILKCNKLLTPEITTGEMSTCLTPVLANPGDEEISSEVTKIMAEAEKIEKDREQKASTAKNYEQQVNELNKLFAEAEAMQAQGYAFKTIKKYNLVVNSDLPDPEKLKNKSQGRIDFIEQKIKEKSQFSINSADMLLKAGNLKEAVIILREARIYDPANKNIQKKIDLFSSELRRQVRALYQDSIIDENYGLIENSETKEGAKEKWKKITELDLEDGEYFRKAIIKLHRYGVQ